MPPIAVDPTVLSAAGVLVAAVGDGLSTAVSTLTGAFNANTGQDASGVMFGRQYESTARDLLKAVAAGVNACKKTGYGIQISAVNYSRAEAQSDISGRSQPLPSAPCPASVSPAGAPNAEGAGVVEPTMWKVVEFLVGDLWPNGDPAAMRTAAAAWRTFGASLYGVSSDMAGPYNTISSQQIPEGELIKAPIRDIGTAFSSLGGSCQQLATQLEAFAADVEQTQNAIRELLTKLGSVGGIVGAFFEFFKGHGEDELHRIANDIKRVMSHLKNEASAKRAGVQQAEQNVDTWVRDLEKAANREFVEFFGDHVGQVLSGAFNSSLDSAEGGFRWLVSNAEGIEDMNPLRIAYDPGGALQTWKGIADLSNAVMNPASLAAMAQSNPQAFEAMLKGLARTDEWSKDRPMLGASQNILDIATLPFAAGKAGEAGEIASAASRAAKAENAATDTGSVTGKLGEAGEAGRAAEVIGNIPKETPQITKSLEDVAGKPTTVEPPAGGRPVSAPHLPETASAPTVKPTPDMPAVQRDSPVESLATNSLPSSTAHDAPAAGEPASAPIGAAQRRDEAVGLSQSGTTSGNAVSAPSTESPSGALPHSTASQIDQLRLPKPGDHEASHAGDHGIGTPESPHKPVSGTHGQLACEQPDLGAGLGTLTHESSPNDPHGNHDEPAYVDSPSPLYELPDPVKVTPPPDGALFWSGRNADGVGVGPKSAGGGGFADNYAHDYNGTTLEGLLEKNGVEPPKWSFDDPAADRWWSDVSNIYAENVQGEVRAVIGSNLRPGNIWETVELPRLMENSDVTRIVVIDPDTGHETVIFNRGKGQ